MLMSSPERVLPSLKKYRPPSRAPIIHPNPLKVCDMLMRLDEVRLSPSSVTYGLAAVSSRHSPSPRTNSGNSRADSRVNADAGIKRKAPTANASSPVITPRRVP